MADGLAEQLKDRLPFRSSEPLGDLERGLSSPVGERWIGAVGEEESDHGDLPVLSAEGRADRIKEGRFACRIGSVDLRAPFEERFGGAEEPSLGCNVERRFSLPIGRVDVRSPGEELSDLFGVLPSISPANVDDRGPSHPIRGVRIYGGAVLGEQPRDPFLIGDHRSIQLLRIGAGLQEQADDRLVVPGEVQQMPTVPAHFGASFDEESSGFKLPGGHRVAEGRRVRRGVGIVQWFRIGVPNGMPLGQCPFQGRRVPVQQLLEPVELSQVGRCVDVVEGPGLEEPLGDWCLSAHPRDGVRADLHPVGGVEASACVHIGALV